MTLNTSKNRTIAAAAAVGAGVLAVAGCGSSSSSTPTATATVTATPTTAAPTTAAPTAAPAGGVPAPPAGSSVVQAPAPDGQATYARYKTSQSPAQVIQYYTGAMKAAGYTVTSAGGGGGGWGQYGGSGAGVTGEMTGSAIDVNAGGSKQGATYFEVCSGATPQIVDNCQSNNHGNSNQS